MLIKHTTPKPNGAFINMKSAFYFFSFLLLSLLSNAQQSILLTKNTIGEISNVQLFKLPIKVTCKIKNQSSKTLVLDRVNGDSLIFESQLNQTNENNCLYSDLKFIQFHNNSYHSKHLFARFSTAIAVFSTAINIYTISKKNTPNNEATQFAAFITFPVALISISLSIISIANLPPKYNYIKYSLSVK